MEHIESTPDHHPRDDTEEWYRMPKIEALLYEIARAWELPLHENRSVRRWLGGTPVKPDTELELLRWIAHELSEAGSLSPLPESAQLATLQDMVFQWREDYLYAEHYQRGVPARYGRWMTFEHLRFVAVRSALLAAAASTAIDSITPENCGWFRFDTRSVGDLIREWASQAKLTQAELDEALPYHEHTLDDWLAGKYIPKVGAQQDIAIFFADKLGRPAAKLAVEMRHRAAMSRLMTKLREHLGPRLAKRLEDDYRGLVDALIHAMDDLELHEDALAGLMMSTTAAPEATRVLERALELEGSALRPWEGLLRALPQGLSAWKRRAAEGIRGYCASAEQRRGIDASDELQLSLYMVFHLADHQRVAAHFMTDARVGEMLEAAGISRVVLAAERFARHYHDRGELRRELQMLRRAVMETPNDAEVLLLAGTRALELYSASDEDTSPKLVDEGLLCIYAAAAARPRWAAPWLVLASAFYREVGWDGAREVLEGAPATIERDIRFRHNLVATLINTECYDRAREELEEVLREDPQLASAWDLLAYCHHRLGNTKERGRAEKRARELGSDYTRRWRQRCKELGHEVPFGEEAIPPGTN